MIKDKRVRRKTARRRSESIAEAPEATDSEKHTIEPNEEPVVEPGEIVSDNEDAKASSDVPRTLAENQDTFNQEPPKKRQRRNRPLVDGSDVVDPNLLSDRGIILISHLSKGFLEHQLSTFFKQFGAITRMRLVRSTRVNFS